MFTMSLILFSFGVAGFRAWIKSFPSLTLLPYCLIFRYLYWSSIGPKHHNLFKVYFYIDFIGIAGNCIR